ncbi:MAG: adenosylcobinamide-phosphate synthase CbiB [Pseudomonadota bacterium]
MICDALFGEPRWLWSRLPHPAVLMGRLVGLLDQKLNRPPAARVAGGLALLILIAVAGMLGWIISQAGELVVVLCAAILLAQRSLIDHVRAVADGLRISLGDGRRAVAMIVGRDVSETPASGIARASIESLAENFSDGVVAPAFWFLVAGLPGIAIYKIVNTADSMIGYRTERYKEFGWAAARFDDLLNWIPARLSAALIALVGGSTRAWTEIRHDAALHRSPNAGWPEAALAHSLNFALSGPRSYHGQMQDFPWVNPNGHRDLGPKEIDASCALVWKAWAALFGLGIISCVLLGL